MNLSNQLGRLILKGGMRAFAFIVPFGLAVLAAFGNLPRDAALDTHAGPSIHAIGAYDRLTSYRDTDGNLIQYHSDANGNVTNIVYPGGKNVYYAFDSLNRLTNVTDWANRKASIIYDLAN